MAVTVSSQWPAVDELSGFSGHGGFTLEKERNKEITREAMNETNDKRNESKDNVELKAKLARG